MSSEEFKADIKDGLIQKFLGNREYTWEQMMSESFYSDISESGETITSHLNWLINSHIIDRQLGNDEFYCLTPYGWKFNRTKEVESFVAAEQREKAQRIKEEQRSRLRTISKRVQVVVVLVIVVVAILGAVYAPKRSYGEPIGSKEHISEEE